MWVFKLVLFSVVFVIFNMVILIMKTKQVHCISHKTPVAKKTSGNPFLWHSVRNSHLSSLTRNDGIFMCDLSIISERREGL